MSEPTKPDFPTIEAWLRAQFGKRPSRRSAFDLRRAAAELNRRADDLRLQARQVERWEENRNGALYGINAAASIASVRKGNKP